MEPEPLLTAEEARVIAVLIEKQLTTPDYYPMSLNAIVNACNQKTNRNPVTDFSQSVVESALSGLQSKRFAGTAAGASARVLKYRHAMEHALTLSDEEIPVLAELMLRGPQTSGEIRGRAGRMHEYASVEQVETILQGLSQRETPLVVRLERQPGQKESRFGHLMCGEVIHQDTVVAEADPDRLDALEARIAALEEAFAQFRSQFE